MSKRLEGKVAIVTAGGQGIGEAISKTYAREGAKVAVVDINGDEAKRVADEAGEGCVPLIVDVTDSDAVDQMVDKVVTTYGSVDILVNAAGGFHRFSEITEISNEEWDKVININLTTVFYCSRACARVMMKNKFGRIIQISSGAGISPNPHAPSYLPYGASKAGVLGFTRLLARDLGPYGITVNAIAPGTALTPRVMKVRDEASLKVIAERNPMRHLIEPQDIGEAALYLASNDGRYVTGVTLPVNAGNLIF
jgi:NAD(P)-dependent dehydrogenase (short-subunit alcohol dehydrogenase family)